MIDRPSGKGRTGDGYEVLAPLASGTYGENLIAVRSDPLGLGKLFVIRQIRRNLSSDERVRNVFVEMSRRAVRLSHPNIVQTYEIGERGGALFTVTEYIEGESLDAVLSAIAPAPLAVDPRLWLLIACEALNGLHYAHELRDFDGTPLGLVHGGISPRRLFIGYSGRVVVTDFGLATLARHARRIEGTFLPEMVSYASPEQRAGKPSDRRADVFSLGLVLWELLAGKRHRNPTSIDKPLESQPPLHEVRENVSPELSKIVAKAIALDPAARWPSALEFRRALEPHADIALLRRGALGDSMTALFARTRDRIPSLLSRRMGSLAKQDPTAIALFGPTSLVPPSNEGEEEEAFLLASPIEMVSEDEVLSVRELVSASELVTGEVVQPSSVEPEPDSGAPVSSVELVVPIDQGSGKRLDVGAVELPQRESSPAVTQRSPGSEAAMVAAKEVAPETVETRAAAESEPPSREPRQAFAAAPSVRDLSDALPERDIDEPSGADVNALTPKDIAPKSGDRPTLDPPTDKSHGADEEAPSKRDEP